MSTPQPFYIPLNRRRFLKSLALASAGFTLPGFLAEALTLAPSTTQGPYYPRAVNIPLDKDNDLVQVGSSTTLAAGTISYLSGRILDASGNPIKNALVELWHADREGDYLYSANSTRNAACDVNFAGFGQFLTGASGEYLFRTIKAGLYNGRTRHYHFAVTVPGRTTRYCTQTFWNETAVGLTGQAWATQNSNDMVLQGITDATQRASVILDWTGVPGSAIGELQANFDFVSSFTPVEPTYPNAGSMLIGGELVAGPSGAPRYKLSFPAYTGYSYEIYGNPTFANLGWAALPFSLSQTGTVDRSIHTATAEGTLNVYVEAPALKGFYHVAFRVPGANTGTP